MTCKESSNLVTSTDKEDNEWHWMHALLKLLQLYTLVLRVHKESNSRQPSCKKSMQPQECCFKKRCEIRSGGQEMALVVG